MGRPGTGRDTWRLVGLAAASVGLAAAAVAVWASRARAQAPIEVVPSLGVTETWSDNVNRTTGETTSGFTTRVTPRLQVRATGERLTGVAGYAASLRIEHFDQGETDVDHDAFAGFDYRFTPRWQGYVREDFRLSPDPTQDLVFVTPGGEAFRSFEQAARTPGVDVLDLRAVAVREEVLRNRLAVGTTYDLTPRLSGGGDVIWTIHDSRDEIFTEDSESWEGRLRTTYRLTPVDNVSLAAALEETEFDRSPSATLVRAETAWDRRLLETVRLSLTAGYVHVESEEGSGLGNESDLTVRASVTGDTATGRWRVLVERDTTGAAGSGDVTERRAVEASLARELGRLTVGDVRLRYLQQRSVRGLGTDSDIFQAIGTVSYRFVRWAAARAAYRYRRDEPADEGPAADENEILVGLEVTWPLRQMPGLRPNP